MVPGATHKVDSHNQLRLGAALARDLCHVVGSVVCGGRAMGRGRTWRRRTIAVAIGRAWRALGRISRRALLRRIGRLLGRVAGRACVDGRQRACWAAMLRRRGPEGAWGSVCVRGRAAQGVLGIHGERGAARVGDLGRERRRALLASGRRVALGRGGGGVIL